MCNIVAQGKVQDVESCTFLFLRTTYSKRRVAGVNYIIRHEGGNCYVQYSG